MCLFLFLSTSTRYLYNYPLLSNYSGQYQQLWILVTCTGSTKTEKEARKIFQVYVLLCFFSQLISIIPLIKPLLLSIFFWAIIVSFSVQPCTRCILMITTAMNVWNVLHLSVRKRMRKAWVTLTPKWLLLTMGKQKLMTNINFYLFPNSWKIETLLFSSWERNDWQNKNDLP